MKKTYFFLLISLLSLTAAATTKTWNISSDGYTSGDHSVTPLASPYTYNLLTLCPNYIINNNNKTDPRTGLDGLGSFAQRLQLPPFSTLPAANTLPTSSYCSFAVDGNSRIVVCCNGLVPVNFAKSDGTVFVKDSCRLALVGANTDTIGVNYVGPATTITIYSPNTTSRFSIYAIQVTPYNPPTDSYSPTQNSISIRANEIINEEEESISIYSINGNMIINSSEKYISIQGLNKGVYIARTQSGETLKFIK